MHNSRLPTAALLLSGLVPVQAEEISPLVVTATRTAQTADAALAAVTVIERSEIERSQARSAVELLRNKAGIHISQNGGYGKSASVLIRGTNSDHVLVLIDGMRAASATLGSFAWENLSPEQIERIEIVRGPRASLYGSDAIGGVIQIFTRHNEGLDARIGGGSDNTREFDIGYGGGQAWRYSIQAGRFDTDGIPTTVQGSQDFGYDNNHLALSVEGTAADKLDLAFKLTHAEGRNELDPNTGDIDFKNQVASLRLEHTTTDIWSQSLTLGYTVDETDSHSPTSPATIITERRSVSWQNDIFLGEGLFTAGIDYWIDDATKDRSGTIDERIYNGAGFVQHQFSALASDWTLGLRYDDHSEFGNETTGNLAWGHDLTANTRLIASYGTAFKAPTVNDLFWPRSVNTFFGSTFITEGNLNLQPEESETAEIGVRHHFGPIATEFNAFYTDVENLIDWQTTQTGTNTFTSTPSNVQDATIRGVELIASTRLRDWNVDASLTFLNAKDDVRDEQLDRRPRRSLDITAARRLGPHGIRIEGLARSARNDREGQVRLAGYGLVNLAYEYRPAPGWQVEARIENAFDREYVLASSFAGDWNTHDRTFLIALEYRGN